MTEQLPSKRILSVDWDFFFPIPYMDDEGLYDWGHRESKLYIDSFVWHVRAASFVRHNGKLPKTDGVEKHFWEKFNNLAKIPLYYADSHLAITELRPILNAFTYVIDNYDAHHDCYKSAQEAAEDGYLDCSDWTLKFWSSHLSIEWIYPDWMDKRRVEEDCPRHLIPSRRYSDFKSDVRPNYDAVFVCRSGAWTPPWIEKQFWKFIDDCPCGKKVALDNITRRKLDQGAINELVVQLNKSFNSLADKPND